MCGKRTLRRRRSHQPVQLQQRVLQRGRGKQHKSNDAAHDPDDTASAIRHALRDESVQADAWHPGHLNAGLSWTHYRALLNLARREVCDFYEVEASRSGCSARQLERQIAAFLFKRVAKSRDKKGVLALAQEGQVLTRLQDVIKGPYVLEFLDLPESHRLMLDGDPFYPDLVFYHVKLKCYVAIDLKLSAR